VCGCAAPYIWVEVTVDEGINKAVRTCSDHRCPNGPPGPTRPRSVGRHGSTYTPGRVIPTHSLGTAQKTRAGRRPDNIYLLLYRISLFYLPYLFGLCLIKLKYGYSISLLSFWTGPYKAEVSLFWFPQIFFKYEG
jgi:hypothetical protein